MTTLCIINHNGERYLRATLDAAMAVRGSFGEMIIVDGGSTDRSLDLVRDAFPSVKVIALGSNLGPGAARNAGFRAAADDRILFIDNDVALESGCADALARGLDLHPDAALAMARVIDARDGVTIHCDGARSHFLGLMALENAGTPLAAAGEGVRAIDSLVTACFLADRGRWGAEAFFDEAFFFHLEDHELGLRARLLGQGIIAAPAARCRHGEGSPGLSIRSTGRHTPFRVTNTMRNRWQLILKLYQARTLFLLAPALLLFEVFQLAGALKKGWLREWAGAAAWIARRLPGILRRRRAFQRRRLLGDGDVLSGGPAPFHPLLHVSAVERWARAALDAAAGANWALASRLLARRGGG